MKAYTYEMGGNGKGKEIEIPANLKDARRKRTRNWWSWWPKATMR